MLRKCQSTLTRCRKLASDVENSLSFLKKKNSCTASASINIVLWFYCCENYEIFMPSQNFLKFIYLINLRSFIFISNLWNTKQSSFIKFNSNYCIRCVYFASASWNFNFICLRWKSFRRKTNWKLFDFILMNFYLVEF